MGSHGLTEKDENQQCRLPGVDARSGSAGTTPFLKTGSDLALVLERVANDIAGFLNIVRFHRSAGGQHQDFLQYFLRVWKKQMGVREV